jgi:pyruvate dehydrogenase E2 component (dihydrolipoamide acetyltransferase)
VDLSEVEGTGAAGRIVRADVERAAGTATSTARAETSPPPAPAAAAEARDGDAPFELVPLTRMRRTIARRLSEAKQTVPHFYLSAECDVAPLLSVRARLNARDDGTRVSVNDFVVRALALALVEVPDANVAWTDEGIRRFGRVDVSVAVATEGGLVTPVVRGAERKGLSTIAEEVRALAARAREGKLAPADYQGGTFSVSNLGMYGIASVYPILNPPQAGILGVGAAEEKPVVRDGAIAPGRVMVCTLAADHRAVDGAVGAELLAEVKRRIEDPLTMLL